MTPAQYVQERAAKSGSSFYYAFLFLPPPRRAAITAFYAFCREVDDVVDETHDPSVAATKLDWWRKEVDAAFAGRASHPVTLALLPLAADHGITAAHLQAVIAGCQIDLEQTRFLDYAGLEHYCHLVAGVVGEVAANIFGRSEAATVQYAHRLGRAMQLTNIIRDVGDDARRGRIYLPLAELQRFEVKAARAAAPRRALGLQRSLRRADALPGRARARDLRRGAGAAARRRPRGAEARADDGQHLPHAAARHRGAGLPGAAPAHVADAAAQALDRHPHPLGGSLMPAARATLAVVGAGWAGLAAAVRGCEAGHRVTLFEMAAQPGGRAREVHAGGQGFDNGQHILIGAYSRTLALMRRVGVDPDAALQRLPLTLRYADGRGLRWTAGPPALAFVRAVVGARGWSVGDRVALLAAATGWAARGFRCDPALTVDALCRGLPPRVRELLIDPLCVAALNTPAREASAVVWLRVLHDALLGGPGAADLLLPRRSLSELLPTPATRWLSDAGATLRLGQRVQAIDAHGTRWSVDGEAFDAVVLACTAAEAARLTVAVAPAWSAQAAALRYEPIVTVYLQARGTRLAEPMMALVDGPDAPAQFAFDHGALGGRDGQFAFVVSGARRWIDAGIDTLEQAVLRQARALLPAPALLRSLAEKRATFRCTPGLRRPGAVIAPGLSAAGDYVDGPYPATIEGAVRAGEAAILGLRLPGAVR